MALKTNFKKIFSVHLLGIATIIALWIKFNIVLFTYQPYTATKVFYPLFFLIIIGYTISHLKEVLKQWRIVAVLFACLILMIIPWGAISHPFQFHIYKSWALSFISYLALYTAVVFLDHRWRNRVFYMTLCFLVLAGVYAIIQSSLDWSYNPGHFRNAATGHRPFGILDDPDHSSGLYILGLFFSLFLFFFHRRFLLIIPYFAFFGIGLKLAGSFGAYFALAGSFAVFIVLLPFVFFKNISLKKITAVFIFCWIVIFFAQLIFIWGYQNNVMDIKNELNQLKSETSIVLRIDYLKIARNIISENRCAKVVIILLIIK